MGDMDVPVSALYGASTQRAVLNFPISGYRFPREFIRALGLIKIAAARSNLDLGKLDATRADFITKAAQEVCDGKLDDQFPVDVFQTGSGTSTNMNANEVIANRCSQMGGKPIGSHTPVHPNDHVNMGQSSNDVIPTAIHIATAESLKNLLLPALQRLEFALSEKSKECWDVIKIGRTHLMDATPIRLGQELSGYAMQVEYAGLRVDNAISAIEEVALGGTAVGTGLNTHPEFARRAVARIAEDSGIAFREAANHFEAQGAKDGLVQVSGQLKTIAVSLFKIASDTRWLSSGPRCAIGEIQLPATQPGSSIMPGKVNPTQVEAITMICARVFGNHATISFSATQGHLELNVMKPVIAFALLESIDLLAEGIDSFVLRCLDGIEPDAANIARFLERSLMLVTALAPKIGYDAASKIARAAHKNGTSLKEEALASGKVTEAEFDAIVRPEKMLAPEA